VWGGGRRLRHYHVPPQGVPFGPVEGEEIRDLREGSTGKEKDGGGGGDVSSSIVCMG
jgi:hypothetical protein